MSAIIVAKDFGYVLLAAGAIALQCYLTGAGVGSARKKYKVDYPDTGCGRYSTKLSDKEWVEFNSVMRAHLVSYLLLLPVDPRSMLLNVLYFSISITY